jgi:hypothetical protein
VVGWGRGLGHGHVVLRLEGRRGRDRRSRLSSRFALYTISSHALYSTPWTARERRYGMCEWANGKPVHAGKGGQRAL